MFKLKYKLQDISDIKKIVKEIENFNDFYMSKKSNSNLQTFEEKEFLKILSLLTFISNENDLAVENLLNLLDKMLTLNNFDINNIKTFEIMTSVTSLTGFSFIIGMFSVLYEMFDFNRIERLLQNFKETKNVWTAYEYKN